MKLNLPPRDTIGVMYVPKKKCTKYISTIVATTINMEKIILLVLLVLPNMH